MTDHITLSGLEGFGYHGVLEHERTIGQRFVVDVDLAVDLELAARSDRLCDTVDYGQLGQRVVGIIGGARVMLIETLALRIAELCLSDARVNAARVTVHKPEAPVGVAFRDVAVTIVRNSISRTSDG